MSIPGHEFSFSHPPLGKIGLPVVVRQVLPNGLTILIQEDRSHPLVAFHAVVRTGSATEGAFLGTGVSHVLEHMLFKGTARRPVGAVEKESRSYGGTSQGFTTFDSTSYQLIVNKEFWSEASDLLVDALFFPSMDPVEFSKERQVVLRELKLRDDDPGQVAWDMLFENAFRIHPYHVPIIGYEPMLKALTPEDTRSYHRGRYVPNNMVIAVVGDVEAKAVIRRMEELTANIGIGPVQNQVLPDENAPVFPREITQEADVTLGIVAMGFPGVSIANPDLFPLDLLSWILGGDRGSRLEIALKETGLVHSVHCWNYTPQHPGLFVVTMRMDADQISKAVEGLLQEIARTRQEGFSATEVEAAKKALLLEYLEGRQTVGGQAADLAGYEVLVGDPMFAYRYVQGMQGVTSEDLRRVAVQYLKPEQRTVVRLSPKGTPSAAEGPSEVGVPLLSVEKVVLDNGLTVLFRRDPRLPLLTLQISMLGGVRYENEKTNGISNLTARMLLRGARRMKASEITERIKEMGGKLSPFSGRNSCGLTMEVVNSERTKALQLLSDLVREPSFPLEELEKEKRLVLAEIKANEEDPFSWGIRRLTADLFSVHPYRFDPLGSPETVEGLVREDLLDFHRRILDPGKIVISIVGDFDKDEVLAFLRKTLGSLPARGESHLSVPPEAPLTSVREHREKSPRNEGLILIGFPGLKITDPHVPVLDLIETILSGGAGRLFNEVRERRGLAYTVGAFAIHGLDPGAFILYAVTDAEQIQTVRQALLEEIKRLNANPVSKEELAEAKQGLLGARRIARQTQAAMAAQMSMDELYGLGYDFSEEYESKIRAVTPADIQALAQGLLNYQHHVVVIGQPREDEKSLAGRQPEEAQHLVAGQ